MNLKYSFYNPSNTNMYSLVIYIHIGFYFYIIMAQLVKNLSARQETPVQLLGREDLLEKG